jgi:3-methylfumaryl-CoA hydratase
LKNELKHHEKTLLIERQNLIYLPIRRAFDKGASQPHNNLSKNFLARRYTENQLFKYSALTMNSHRIHYDLDYCKNVEQYPSLVVHGPLLAQNLIDAANQKLEGELRFFKYRALNPVFVSDEFTINFSDNGEFWIMDKSGILSMSAVAS